MKRVFICSRYRGNTHRNAEIAARLCRMALNKGYAPFAPHLLYTRFTDEAYEAEREIGIACGLDFMGTCDEVWVYMGEGVSDGMTKEIEMAGFLGKKVIKIDSLYLQKYFAHHQNSLQKDIEILASGNGWTLVRKEKLNLPEKPHRHPESDKGHTG